MVLLNNDKPHDSSNSEEDPWEIVGDETTPLAVPSPNNAAAVPDNYIGDVTVINAERVETDDAQLAGGEIIATVAPAAEPTEKKPDHTPRDRYSLSPTDVLLEKSGNDSSLAKQAAIRSFLQDVNPRSMEMNEKVQSYTAEKMKLPTVKQEHPAPATNLSAKPAEPNITDGHGHGSESFHTAASPIAAETRTVHDGEEAEDEFDKEKGADTLAPSTEREVPAGTLLDFPWDILGEEKIADEVAYYDKKSGRWVLPGNVLAGAPEELQPAGKTGAPDTPVAVPTAESTEKTNGLESEESLSTVASEKETSLKASSDISMIASAEKAYKEKCSPEKPDSEKSESSHLLESLSNMGFEREKVEKAVAVLREEGRTEIDENSVVEEIERKKNDDSLPWDPFVEFSAQDIELLRRRTKSVTQNIGLSAKEMWSNARDESQRFHRDIRAKCDEAEVRERTVLIATKVKSAASLAKDSICRANEEHRITDKLATAAVVGGATLLVLGNPRAGVGVVAVAGATLAAGEAMKHSSARSTSTYTRDYGLGEGLHID